MPQCPSCAGGEQQQPRILPTYIKCTVRMHLEHSLRPMPECACPALPSQRWDTPKKCNHVTFGTIQNRDPQWRRGWNMRTFARAPSERRALPESGKVARSGRVSPVQFSQARVSLHSGSFFPRLQNLDEFFLKRIWVNADASYNPTMRVNPRWFNLCEDGVDAYNPSFGPLQEELHVNHPRCR